MKKKPVASNLPASFWEILTACSLILWVVALNHTQMDENDTWWHIALGKWMVQNHQIYKTEIFSAVGLGRPFLAHEWLSEVLFYLFSSPSGKWLSYFKLFLIGVACTGFGYLLARPYFKSRFTPALLVPLAFLIAFRAPVRPQIFEIICASFLLLTLNFWKESPSWKRLLGLIPVQVLWANLHGSYLLGPVLVFLFALGLSLMQIFPFLPGDKEKTYSLREQGQLLGLSLILLGVSLINPFHFELLHKSFSVFFLDSYMKEHIREWFSVTRVEKGIWFYVWSAWIFSHSFSLFWSPLHYPFSAFERSGHFRKNALSFSSKNAGKVLEPCPFATRGFCVLGGLPHDSHCCKPSRIGV